MPQLPLRPYWQTTDRQLVRIYLGDVLDVLRRIPSGSVHCVCTSPPYWGLRAYATGDSKHQEIGSESSPDEYVAKMVEVFREARRVLRDDGTLWLNLGDSYSGGSGGYATQSEKQQSNNGTMIAPRQGYKGLPSGNLVGIPWRVALALQADGWILRSDIPWVKRSPMPESVKNRPAKALEYVFMFVKRMGYFYDDVAVKRHSFTEPHAPGWSTSMDDRNDRQVDNEANHRSWNDGSTRNFWQADLWFDSVDKPHGLTGIGDEIVGIDVTSQGYSGAHFATFPCALVRPFIQAGTSERGCCAECGAPWKRITERQAKLRERPNDYVKRTGEEGTGNSCANTVAGVESRTVGWRPTCECNGRLEKQRVVVEKSAARVAGGDRNGDGDCGASPREEGEKETTITEYVSDLPLDEHPTRPCVVLDPFCGSGTTNIVAIEQGRRSVGIDLSEAYLREQAIPRIEGHLLARPDTAGQVQREVKPTTGGKRVGVRRMG